MFQLSEGFSGLRLDSHAGEAIKRDATWKLGSHQKQKPN
jgi:hypothetical protein